MLCRVFCCAMADCLSNVSVWEAGGKKWYLLAVWASLSKNLWESVQCRGFMGRLSYRALCQDSGRCFWAEQDAFVMFCGGDCVPRFRSYPAALWRGKELRFASIECGAESHFRGVWRKITTEFLEVRAE